MTRPVSLPSGKARKMSAKVGYVYAVESIDGKHHELVTAKAGMNVIPLGPEATKEGR